MILEGISGKKHRVNKRDMRIGITSKVSKRMHLPLIDFDNEISLRKMQRQLFDAGVKLGLSNFYIIRSSRGKFHAISFKPVTRKKYYELLDLVNCDPKFRWFTKRAGSGTLRITKKKEPMSIVRVVKLRAEENEQLKDQYFKLFKFENLK